MSNRQNNPSIGVLSFTLRHKELWPASFHWNYGACSTCAMGLASELWPQTIFEVSNVAMRKAFDLTEQQAQIIFGDVGDIKRCSHDDVTPEMVADVIDVVT